MLTLSRLAQDMIIFSMPEFGYVILPSEMCTGSSIMPQKQNPDVLELIRARASTLLSASVAAVEIVKALPSGYNRDLQEIKGHFITGVNTTYKSLQIMKSLLDNIQFNRKKIIAAFSSQVFAADKALELVAEGMPFRDAYNYVKANLNELNIKNPQEALKIKKHTGAPYKLSLQLFENKAKEIKHFGGSEKKAFYKTITKLLKRHYPF
jgi:argininosuccinate lyase